MPARDRYQTSAKDRNATDVRRRRAQLAFQEWTVIRVIMCAIEAGPTSPFLRAIVEIADAEGVNLRQKRRWA